MRNGTCAALVLIFVAHYATAGWAAEPKPGEPVDGLQITLTSAKPVWELGTVMEFEATLKNVSDKLLMTGMFGELNTVYTWVDGAYAEGPWLLSWQQAETDRDVLGPRTINGGERTWHEGGPNELLQPGAVYVKRLSYKLDNFPAGRYSITLSYAPMPQPATRPVPPLWMGRKVYSNPLNIEVTEARKTTN